MAYSSFEELEVWKKACRLAVDVYACLRDSRDFSIREQMQRASISIASNLAEGHERGGKDFIRFLRIASGSAAELRTQLYIAVVAKILDETESKHLIDEAKSISRMIHGLSKSLQASTRKAPVSRRKPKTEN